jgi:uncharacterized hydrophobic protein (TIGR00271 family)
MIHLRLVAPPARAGEVLEFLHDTPSVINLIHMRGAAHKPDGDVILCDVAREDASRVLTELRQKRLHHEGTIAVLYVDTAISDAARAAERAAPGNVSDAVIWESVRGRTFEEADLSFSFIAFMVLASLIAAFGILTESIILLIGGMIVSPEFGPLAGMSVSIVEARWRLALKSAMALLIGFPTGIAAAYVCTEVLKWTGVAPDVLPPNRDATLFISHPDWYAFLVALAAGIAGTLSLTTVKSAALIGVLVSVTTMPAAANIAVSAAYNHWDNLWGSTLQLTVNLGALVLGGTGTLLVERWAYQRRAIRQAKKAGVAAV